MADKYDPAPETPDRTHLKEPGLPGGKPVQIVLDDEYIDRQVARLRDNGVGSLHDLVIALEQAYDGIILTDLEGRVFYANELAIGRLSKRVGNMTTFGKRTEDFLDIGTVSEVTKTRIPDTKVIVMTHKLKTGKEVLLISVPVYKDGKKLCFVTNYKEINDQHSIESLLSEIDTENQSNESELMELRNRLVLSNELIANSVSMKNILKKILKAAPTDANVLIHGESGVGKEVIAALIHKTSDRSGHPFVQINCGAIPENLLESELFGYERGAFTGASSSGKPGILETARNGTVLLDEIGDIPLNIQVKLLKALQDRHFYRLGGVKAVSFNARIICATNKDLKKMVSIGSFREDLFFRIYVIPIYIPPLRERREDILPLAQMFLQKFNKKYCDSGYVKTFTSELCSILYKYDWPGNVRELENLIEQMVIMSDGPLIKINHLPSEEFGQIVPHSNLEGRPLKQVLEDIEKSLIEEALEEHGSVRKAAEALGVDHSTLVKKRMKYRSR